MANLDEGPPSDFPFGLRIFFTLLINNAPANEAFLSARYIASTGRRLTIQDTDRKVLAILPLRNIMMIVPFALEAPHANH